MRHKDHYRTLGVDRNASEEEIQNAIHMLARRYPERWGKTDYPETVNHEDLGDLGLTDQQVDDLVALMSAFTDRSLLTKDVREGGAFPVAPAGTPTTESMKLEFPDWTQYLHPAHPRPRVQAN